MQEFSQIWVDRLDKNDVQALLAIEKSCYYGHTVDWILDRVTNFELALWRGKGTKIDFLLLTQLRNYPGGKELFLWGVGGKGYLRSAAVVIPKLISYAKSNACRWLTGISARDGFEKVHELQGAKILYKHYVVELDK